MMHVYIALAGLFLVGVNCGESDFDAVVLNSNLFGEQPAENNGQFWWMSKGSPFKRAVAAGPPQQQFDFAANPFLRSNAGNSAKLYSAPGYLPPDQQRPQTVPCQGNGRVCVPKYQCQGGYIDASQVNGQNSQECNIDSEVCCQIRVPVTPRPTPPPTRASYIPPAPPTRSQPQPTQCYDRSSVCVPANQCYNGAVSRGSPYTSRAPASQCLAPEVCCRVPDEPRPTASPSVTVVSYQPSPTTQRPYITPAVQTQRPQVITKRPNVNNQYLPPRDNEVPQGNNPVGAYLPPDRGEDEKSPQIPANSNDAPYAVRPPSKGNDELSEPIIPPSACPAATNCTEIQFCKADGTISTSPVVLTKEQETYRVPLSPCRDQSKGISQGVCCRDPNYTDPWPTNLLRTGAFDANVLAQAFDDGQYRAGGSGNGNGNGRNQRGEAQKSPQINPINPFTASSQQTKQYTNAPFITNAIPNNNKPIKTSVSQQPTSPNPFKFQPNQQTFSPPSQFNTPQQNQPSQPQFVPQNQPQQAYSQSPATFAQPSTNQFATTPSFPTPSPVSQQYKQPEQPTSFTPQQPHGQTFQPQQPQQPHGQTFQPQQPQQPQHPHGQTFQPEQPQQPHGQTFQPQQPHGQTFQPQQPQQPQQPHGQTFQPQQPQQPQQPHGQTFQPEQPQQPHGQTFQPQQPQQPHGQTFQPQQPQQPQPPHGQTFQPEQPQQPHGQTFQPQQPQQPQQPHGQTFQPQQPQQPQPPHGQTFQPEQPQQPQQPHGQTFQPQQPQQPHGQTFQPQQPSSHPEQPPFQPQGFQPQQPAFEQDTPLQNPFQPSPPGQNPFRANQLGVCSVRDQLGLPRGNAPNEAAFGEFPWQAMILRESTKTILCGGAIIERNLVATAAHCVDGLRTHDVLIKAGEWKLGSNEEPKPFQTVRVKQITMHPAYQPTNLESDVALLHLENDLKFDKHIGPICVDESELEPAQGTDEECVTSGWGKENIKYHIAGALPHSLAINPLNAGECQASFGSFNPNSAVCGRAQGNPCDVDNGSALACTRGNGRYLLKGIYSGESGCGPNQVMKFTKMDVDFIKGGSAEKSLPINPTSHGSFPGSQPTRASYTSTAQTARGLKKYLPPLPQ